MVLRVELSVGGCDVRPAVCRTAAHAVSVAATIETATTLYFRVFLPKQGSRQTQKHQRMLFKIFPAEIEYTSNAKEVINTR
jgi:hypothetical protein